jgi:hypothetical protein
MAVKDLKRLLLKYESNLANKANYNASKLARVNTYNNRDYVVDLSKKTIIKNTKDNIRVAGRDEPTAAELENIWERTIASIKAAIPPFGGTGNKSVGGAGQFKVTWNSSNTIMYIKNVKNDPWSGQSTHTFLLKLRQKLEKEVWGFNVGSVANKKRGTSTTAGVDIGHVEDLILVQLKDTLLGSINDIIRSFKSTKAARGIILDDIAKELRSGVASGSIPFNTFIEVTKNITSEGTIKMGVGVGAEDVPLKTFEKWIEVQFEATWQNQGQKSKDVQAAAKLFKKTILPEILKSLNKLVGQNDWPGQKASPAINEMIDTMIENSLFSTKSVNTRFGSKAKSKKKAAKLKSKVTKVKKYLRKKPKKPPPSKGDIRNYIQDPRGNWISPISLTSLIDGLVGSQVAANMGTPALNYRTGRFSESVEVLDIMPDTGITIRGQRQEQVTAYYTYMKRPYETFERKDKWGEFKNPRRLIDKSIREIATKYINARYDLRTVRL